jgi:hypothetical protein
MSAFCEHGSSPGATVIIAEAVPVRLLNVMLGRQGMTSDAREAKLDQSQE